MRNSALWTTYFNANGVGWETNSRYLYPKFANVGDMIYATRVPYSNADYRLKSTSPARYTGAGTGGVTLPPPPGGSNPPDATHWPDSATYTTTPDVGALPYGSTAVAVGVDGRFVFPSTTKPLAEAGDFSSVNDTNNDGFEKILLNGTGSIDPDGTISSYKWTLNGYTILSSSTGSASLPSGTAHQVFLTVTNNSGNTAQDMREVTITGPDNLVRNPSFESGTTNWDFFLGSGSIVTTPLHFGGKALNIPGTTGAGTPLITQAVPIVPGAAVTVSGWISGTGFTPGAHGAKVQLQWLDASGASISIVDGVNTQNTAYVLRTQTLTAPANAVTAKVRLILYADSAPGTAYYDTLFLAITDNKLANGHFERGLIINSGVPTVTTDRTLSRTASAALRLNGTTSTVSVRQLIPVTVSQTYSVSGWIKASGLPAGKFGKVDVQWCDTNGNVLANAGSTMTSGNVANYYTRVQQHFTAPASPAGIVKMRVVPLIDAAATGATVYVDDIYVK